MINANSLSNSYHIWAFIPSILRIHFFFIFFFIQIQTDGKVAVWRFMRSEWNLIKFWFKSNLSRIWILSHAMLNLSLCVENHFMFLRPFNWPQAPLFVIPLNNKQAGSSWIFRYFLNLEIIVLAESGATPQQLHPHPSWERMLDLGKLYW